MTDHWALIITPLLLFLLAYFVGRCENVRKIEAVRSVTALTLILSIVTLFIWNAIAAPNLSPLRLTLLTMVSMLGWSLLRFSKAYMAGEANLHYYYRWLIATLAGVLVTIISTHLLTLWLGWVSISLSLHQLLTFYPERPRALLAAHKKFILARIAELTLAAAFILLYIVHGHADLPLMAAYYQSATSLTAIEEIIVLLLSITAAIKSAQLPVHGWLIKVVEAPTPVSALLHAGVINLGGILLLFFAPLLTLSQYGIWPLAIIALFTLVLSALIMTTRISVKVRLAWSTSAQMGLMLLEIALGLYQIALLHLVGHSCYKAYQFLMSGSAVNHNAIERMQPMSNLSLTRILITLCVTLGATLSLVLYLTPTSLFAPWVLLALAISGLILFRHRLQLDVGLPRTLLICLGMVLSYLLSSAAADQVLTQHFWQLSGKVMQYGQTNSLMDILTSISFILLFLVATALLTQAHLKWVQTLSQRLFAGLYLDEWFTRQTLKIWPTDLQRGQPVSASSTLHNSAIKES